MKLSGGPAIHLPMVEQDQMCSSLEVLLCKMNAMEASQKRETLFTGCTCAVVERHRPAAHKVDGTHLREHVQQQRKPDGTHLVSEVNRNNG